MTSTFRKPNPWTRRTLLGGGFVIATAGAAGVWRGIDTGVILPDQSPYDPWKEWTSSQSGDPLSLVSSAILAASPHNTQPWLFKVRDNTLSIYANEDRNLGAFDPYRREMWHGLGCAIANVEIAAPARGFATSTQLAPDPSQPMLAATITLSSPNGPLDPLVEMIVKRTTNRANYVLDKKPDATLLLQATPTETDTVRTIWVDANSVQGSAMIAQSIIATQNIIADKVMSAESYRWFRHSPRQVAKYRDGPQAAVAGIDPMFAKLSPLLPELSAQESDGHWLESTRRQLQTAPMFGFVMVRDLYSRKSQLLAGAVWQRLHLGLTKAGLAAQPINQIIEWVDREHELRQPPAMATLLSTITGQIDWKPTFAFRAGYTTHAMPHSARRARGDVVTLQ
jgi:hypothetical protein